MNLLRRYVRALLLEARLQAHRPWSGRLVGTDDPYGDFGAYDDEADESDDMHKLVRLMDAGEWDVSFALADSLGMDRNDLPWTTPRLMLLHHDKRTPADVERMKEAQAGDWSPWEDKYFTEFWKSHGLDFTWQDFLEQSDADEEVLNARMSGFVADLEKKAAGEEGS